MTADDVGVADVPALEGRPAGDAEPMLRALEASFKAFAGRFRQDIGRPMTEQEWYLAQLAHSFGFTDGVDDALRLAVEMEAAAEPAMREDGHG